MPELRNPRRERFCQAYIALGNASEAYRRSGYRIGTQTTLTTDSSRMLTFADVKQRLTELKAEQLFKMKLEREELAGFYAAAIKTPAGEVTPSHPLCQSYKTSKNGVEVRMPDKVAAATALARLAGWDVQRVEIQANPLTDYLRSLRSAEVKELPDSGAPTS